MVIILIAEYISLWHTALSIRFSFQTQTSTVKRFPMEKRFALKIRSYEFYRGSGTWDGSPHKSKRESDCFVVK